MDPTLPSRRPSSAPSISPAEVSRSESDSNLPDTSRLVAKHPSKSRTSLARPFRSPLKRGQAQQSMDTNPSPATSEALFSAQIRVEPSTCSSASVRKQRQALEGRLLLLQQANKCLRESALSTLPQEIARWREAGQQAAQDLWKLTGAEGGDWSATGAVPSRGDYGLESPPCTLSNESKAHKRKASQSPHPSSPPWLLRRSRLSSPGAEEEAAALRSTDDPIRRITDQESQDASSETSLPEISELLRRSQSVVGASSTPRQRQSLLGAPIKHTTTSYAAQESGRGIERKWNIGSMLDMLGADKATLDWDVEEEDFRDPGANSSDAIHHHRTN